MKFYLNSILNLLLYQISYSTNFSEIIDLPEIFDWSKFPYSTNFSEIIDSPETFDRSKPKKKYHCIHDLYNQGFCECSSYIVALSVLSDRLCIKTDNDNKNTQHQIHFSPLYLLRMSNISDHCRYVQPKIVWENIKKNGIIENDCEPFLGYTNKFNFNRTRSDECILQSINFTKYYIGNYTEINNDKLKAMVVIINEGPIQAELETFEDFYSQERYYSYNKVYSYSWGMFKKKVSIKIIGWNIEDPFEPFWIAMVPLGSLKNQKIKIRFNEFDFDSSFIYADILIP